MKKEQRVMAWTALQYYVEMAEKELNMAKELDDTDYHVNYWQEQLTRAKETMEAVLKAR